VPTRKQLEVADRILSEFDWTRYDVMTDEEIRAHWRSDPDMTWPSEKELAEFDLVIPAESRRKRHTEGAE